MKEKFKVNFLSQLRSAKNILIQLLIGLGFCYFMSIKTDDSIKVFLWILLVVFVILSGPAIITHINYYIVNRGYYFYYDNVSGEITVGHGNEEDIFSLADIQHIDRFMSFNLAAKRTSFTTGDDYNYSVIFLNNGKQFTITSLLVPNLNLPISQEKIEVHEGFFRFAKLK
ncbi:hypothetical protein [Pedobacter sp. SG908]|uniref:hypothetical protein n=1 Tax=Pedobacter sp. SG908 TaxID=2587135 RepID=UPI001420FA38|nr:hypothetical protein [Pedobacter sp. SG908]NII83707.1 hypothetical protein [Pedobacter sp. SG908]